VTLYTITILGLSPNARTTCNRTIVVTTHFRKGGVADAVNSFATVGAGLAPNTWTRCLTVIAAADPCRLAVTNPADPFER